MHFLHTKNSPPKKNLKVKKEAIVEDRSIRDIEEEDTKSSLLLPVSRYKSCTPSYSTKGEI